VARETKAERLAREQVEREARLAAEVAEYPARLMAALERVNNQYQMTLKVENSKFVVMLNERRHDFSDNEYVMAYSYDVESQDVLDQLYWRLEALEEAQAEAKRRDEVRREALRKVNELLSKEERELLGMK
jgi:hypothetical protein